MSRTLLFSVTKNDFEMQTFSVGGHGGSGKDTSNSGCRLVHKKSGAVGEGREHRSLSQNRKEAFLRLVKTKKFMDWHKIECARAMGQKVPETEAQIRDRVNKTIDNDLKNGSILIEEF